MAGGVTIKVRADLVPALHRATLLGLQRAAARAVTMIRQRTAGGSDTTGRPFRPYTARYRKLKEASGRDSGRVDLTLTGQMLQTLAVLRTEESPRPRVVLGFLQRLHQNTPLTRRRLSGKVGSRITASKRMRRSSMAAVVRRNNELRPFFDIRLPRERAELVAIIRDTIVRNWRGSGRR